MCPKEQCVASRPGSRLATVDYVDGTPERVLWVLKTDNQVARRNLDEFNDGIGDEMAIGDIPGIEPGAKFANRRALFDARVHRQLQAGIVGREETGAESRVLSGGYVDDEDHGSEIIYTGHGGRDPLTGKQISHQEFRAQNRALVVSRLEDCRSE